MVKIFNLFQATNKFVYLEARQIVNTLIWVYIYIHENIATDSVASCLVNLVATRSIKGD